MDYEMNEMKQVCNETSENNKGIKHQHLFLTSTGATDIAHMHMYVGIVD